MKLQEKTTIKDIADQLNVSFATVSRALNGKSGVSDEKRLEIQGVAKQMGYSVNNVARIMSRKLLNIGVIIPSFWGEYYLKTKSGMDSEFLKLSEYKINSEFYYISTEFSKNNENHLKNWIKKRKLDAVIFAPTFYTINEIIVSVVHRLNIPLFLAGGGVDSKNGVTTVTEDAEFAGKLAADFFECFCGSKIQALVFTSTSSDLLNNIKVGTFKRRVEEAGGTVCAVLETYNASEIINMHIQTAFQKHPQINCIYVNTADSKEICRYIDENNLKNKIILLGTDRYSEQDEYIKSGVMKAAIFQNQGLLGQKAVRSAYDYLVKTKSYGNEDWEPPKKILVRPQLHLKTDIE